MVICSSEHEDTSYLASALEKYRVVSPPSSLQQVIDIQEFLRREFTPKTKSQKALDLQCAARADIDG